MGRRVHIRSSASNIRKNRSGRRIPSQRSITSNMASAGKSNARSTDPNSRATNSGRARSSAGKRRRCAIDSAFEERSARVASIVSKAHRTSKGSSFKAAVSISRPGTVVPHDDRVRARTRASAPSPAQHLEQARRLDAPSIHGPIPARTRSDTNASTSTRVNHLNPATSESLGQPENPRNGPQSAPVAGIRTGSSERRVRHAAKSESARSR
jgi:hypothetical protein